jgi:hypothetical protein
MEFYESLLGCLSRSEVHEGQWQLFDCRAAWEGNPSFAHFIAFGWHGPAGERLMAAINFGPTQGQCFVSLRFPSLAGQTLVFRDLMGVASYTRDGDDLARRGLYLDMRAWGFHVFEVVPR